MSYSAKNNDGGAWQRSIPLRMLALATMLGAAAAAHASAPGITGTAFQLQANQGYSVQPDGMQIYSWGYGCASSYTPTFAPAVFNSGIGFCPGSAGTKSNIQLPGPTMIVTEGQAITVTLTNNLPVAAGNTSIVFAGIPTTAAAASPQPPGCTAASPVTTGLLTTEVAPGCSVV